uniref:Uncharacterized protein n=1 Tax=Sparus aurata TaxID=8175 RepID=A0A671XAA4_SPAAU
TLLPLPPSRRRQLSANRVRPRPLLPIVAFVFIPPSSSRIQTRGREIPPVARDRFRAAAVTQIRLENGPTNVGDEYSDPAVMNYLGARKTTMLGNNFSEYHVDDDGGGTDAGVVPPQGDGVIEVLTVPKYLGKKKVGNVCFCKTQMC